MLNSYFPLPTQAGIALGSNLGDSKSILKRAIDQLQKIHISHHSAFLVSSFYKTAPIGCPPDSPDFLNAVVQLETSLSPYNLIEYLQSLETAADRPRHRIKNTPRTLDLDLLYHGTTILKTELLVLPHPRILGRDFVLKPLVEISPFLTLLGWKKTAKEYLFNLSNNVN